MKIQDLMTTQVVKVRPDQNLAEAARFMKESEIGFLPVAHPTTGALEGVLTDRDICIAALDRGQSLGDIRVDDVMSRSVYACDDSGDLISAHELMREHHVHRLPVTNREGRIVGVLSIDDLARAASNKVLSHSRSQVAETVGIIGRSHLRA